MAEDETANSGQQPTQGRGADDDKTTTVKRDEALELAVDAAEASEAKERLDQAKKAVDPLVTQAPKSVKDFLGAIHKESDKYQKVLCDLENLRSKIKGQVSDEDEKSLEDCFKTLGATHDVSLCAAIGTATCDCYCEAEGLPAGLTVAQVEACVAEALARATGLVELPAKLTERVTTLADAVKNLADAWSSKTKSADRTFVELLKIDKDLKDPLDRWMNWKEADYSKAVWQAIDELIRYHRVLVCVAARQKGAEVRANELKTRTPDLVDQVLDCLADKYQSAEPTGTTGTTGGSYAGTAGTGSGGSSASSPAGEYQGGASSGASSAQAGG